MIRFVLRALGTATAVGCLTVAGVVAAIEIAAACGDFPMGLLSRRPRSLEVRDRRGRPLRDVLSARQERARWLPLSRMAPTLLAAAIAAEDARFLEHRGIDYGALARAAWDQLHGRHSGGSTITQQVVKLLRPRVQRSLGVKWRELLLARRLERRANKARILEEYLNRAPLGPQLVGAGAASRAYFGKEASALSLAESALLAGLAQAPSALDPRRYPRRARRRRATVLGRMLRLGLLTREQHRRALADPLIPPASGPPFAAPHFVTQVLRRLPERVGPIDTTLDLRLQRRAETLVRRTTAAMARHGATQAAALVLDNRTGQILAWVGSKDWHDEREGRNDGVVARRQPGSALKPFAYALAFERRAATPASLLTDLPAHYTTPTGDYLPRNFDGRFHGPVLAREALANSYNVPAVRLVHRLGARALLRKLRALGFTGLTASAEHYGLGVVLGNGEVTLLEITSAYAALARQGRWIQPSFVLGAPRPRTRRVFSRQAAWLVTDILSDPSARVAAFGERSALDLPFPAAVKTGTSSDFRDNWTVGYTPEVTVGVWVGSFSGRPMHGVSGVSGAAQLWNRLMRAVMERRPHRPFRRPAGLVGVRVCSVSGGRAGPLCPGRRIERFVAGTEPGDRCSVHVEVEIDRRNGLLAGPACPPSVRRRLRVERYPPRFAAWAAAAKRPLGPARHSVRCPAAPTATIRIVTPYDGQVLGLTPDLPRRAQRLVLEAVVNGAPHRVAWRVDSRVVARAPFPYSARWTIRPGTHRIVAEAKGTRSEPVQIVVRE